MFYRCFHTCWFSIITLTFHFYTTPLSYQTCLFLIEYFGVIIKLHFIKQLHVYMILDVQYMCFTFSRMVDVPYLYSPHFFYKESSSSSTCTCIYTTCILLLQYVFVKYFISDLDLDIFPLISEWYCQFQRTVLWYWKISVSLTSNTWWHHR